MSFPLARPSRSIILPRGVGSTLREHRDRLRALEASPSGGLDGPWTFFVSFLNGWTGVPSLGDSYQDPFAGYMLDSDGFVHLRGRLFTPGIGGSWLNGSPACVLPAGLRPPFDQWFAVDGSSPLALTFDFGSGVSHVLVKATGEVIPFVNQPGVGLGDPNAVTYTFPGGHTPLDPLLWANEPGLHYGNVTGGGFGILAGAFPGTAPVAALYATDMYADTDVSVTWQGGSSLVLGLQVQPQTVGQPYPDGYYVFFAGTTAGSVICFVEERAGFGSTIICSNAFTPNRNLVASLSPGDRVTFRRTHIAWTLFVNGARLAMGIKSTDSFPGDVAGGALGRGVAALGGVAAADAAIVSDISVGQAGTVSACLDGIVFRAA